MQSLPNSHLNWQCGGLHCEKTDFHSLKNRFSLKKRQWIAQSLLTSSQWKRDKAELLKITPESNRTSILLWTQYIEMNFDNSYYIVKKHLLGLIKFCTVPSEYTTIQDFHQLALMLKMIMMCDLLYWSYFNRIYCIKHAIWLWNIVQNTLLHALFKNIVLKWSIKYIKSSSVIMYCSKTP